jgi:hypothetical protein
MSERDFWDEESFQKYKAELIQKRNSLNPTTQKLQIKVCDNMIKDLPNHYLESQVDFNENKQAHKDKIPSSLTSKRVALVVSLLLCVTLYLLLLSTAFTTNRDTYICYITKTGECFHEVSCRYISKSAYETTVYEACHDYKPCWNCNPCIKAYKTTITVRNYVYPALISIPLSISVFLLLGYRKKE